MDALWLIAVLYALWILFLAAMNLRTAREAGKLPRAALWLAVPVVLLAFALDVIVNLTLGTLVFMDRPREWTVSERLSRYLPGSDWRACAAMWIGENLLDPFDPSGSHLR